MRLQVRKGCCRTCTASRDEPQRAGAFFCLRSVELHRTVVEELASGTSVADRRTSRIVRLGELDFAALIQTGPDLPLAHFTRIGRYRAHARRRRRPAVAHTEAPEVKRALDLIAQQLAFGQGTVAVRAPVIGYEALCPNAEHGEHAPAELDAQATSRRDVRDAAEGCLSRGPQSPMDWARAIVAHSMRSQSATSA